MRWPFQYPLGDSLPFGGDDCPQATFADAPTVVLPAPLERTVSYLSGTRLGPSEILRASSQLELWDEDLGIDVHTQGICTLPEMELPYSDQVAALTEINQVAKTIISLNKFLVTLGGEHSITPPLVAAAAANSDPGLIGCFDRLIGDAG